MLVTQAYRFAPHPTPAQRRELASHCGGRRFAYNWGLALVKARSQLRERVRRAALTEQLCDTEVERLARTVVVPWTLPALRREWNADKDRAAPWWAQNSKEAYSARLADLARGLDSFWKSKRGVRKEPRVGFPRFKDEVADGSPTATPPAALACRVAAAWRFRGSGTCAPMRRPRSWAPSSRRDMRACCR